MADVSAPWTPWPVDAVADLPASSGRAMERVLLGCLARYVSNHAEHAKRVLVVDVFASRAGGKLSLMAGGPVVLVVEDEEPNRALLRAVLARATDERLLGLTLLEAPDPASARAILATNRVDLVLLDVRLPDGNGLSVITDEAGREALSPPFVVLRASVLPCGPRRSRWAQPASWPSHTVRRSSPPRSRKCSGRAPPSQCDPPAERTAIHCAGDPS